MTSLSNGKMYHQWQEDSVLVQSRPMTIRERFFMLLNCRPNTKKFGIACDPRYRDADRLKKIDELLAAQTFGDLHLARVVSAIENKEPVRGTDTANPRFFICFGEHCSNIALCPDHTTPFTLILCSVHTKKH